MRYSTVAASVLASLALLPQLAAAEGMNVQIRDGREVRTCADLEVTFDGRAAVTAVDQLTAPGGQKLTVHGSRNGGVYVYGGSRTDFGISVCKAAAPASGGGAALDQVKAGVIGGTLTATGPGTDGWVVYFIVDAPTQASVDLDVTNGPMLVSRITGATTVRSQNGPIRLREVSGRVSAKTENGPLAFDGGSGIVELEAQNGPLAIHLAGSKWAEGSLTARAQNGPVKLQVPRGFASGVRVNSSQHSPWKCSGCEDGKRTWDDASRSVELGSGPVAVTLSTVNGPVSVDMAK